MKRINEKRISAKIVSMILFVVLSLAPVWVPSAFSGEIEDIFDKHKEELAGYISELLEAKDMAFKAIMMVKENQLEESRKLVQAAREKTDEFKPRLIALRLKMIEEAEAKGISRDKAMQEFKALNEKLVTSLIPVEEKEE